MRMPKTLFSCVLIATFHFYASSNIQIPKPENRKPHTQGTEQAAPLQNPKNKTDIQQLITTALLNENPKKRKEAEDSLYDIRAVNSRHKKAIAQLTSDFPYDHLKALETLENAINTNPTIRYIVLKDLFPRILSLEVQRKLAEITSSSLNLQQNLLAITTSEKAYEAMRRTAEDILAKLHSLRPEIREALLQKITTPDQIPHVIQSSAKNILRLHSDRPEIQKRLAEIVTSDEFSIEAQKVAEELLLKTLSFTLTTQQKLSDTLISSSTSNRGRIAVANILTNREYTIYPVTIDPDIQIKLTKAAISDEVTDVVRKTAETVVLDIIINSQKMSFHSSSDRHSGIEQELVDTITSNNVSETERNRATILIKNIDPLQEISQTILLQKAISRATPKIVKKAVKDILVHTEYISPNIKKKMRLTLKCRRAFRKINVFNTK